MKNTSRVATVVLGACMLVMPAVSSAADGDGKVVGTQKGMFRLLGGGALALTSPDATLSLHGQVEYMVSDMIGLKGMGGIPLGDGPHGVKTLPGYLGANIHLLPKSILDLHVGAAVGMAMMMHSQWGNTLFNPCAQAAFGGSLYLFGPFFGSMEGGYEIKKYSNAGHSVGMSGLFGNVQGGLFF